MMIGERWRSIAEAREFDRRLAVVSTAIAATYGASILALALLPILVRDLPVLLILLNPATGVLLLVSERVGLVTFIALAVLRRVALHLLFFLLGAWYGKSAVRWVEQRGGRGTRLVGIVERAFARVRWPVLLLAPGPVPGVLSGAGRMGLGTFLAFDTAGALLGVLVARFAADVAADPLGAALRFSDRHAGLLTALCAAATASWLLIRWYRARRSGAQPGGQ